MDDSEIDLATVKRLIGIVESSGLSELVVESDGVSIRIRGEGRPRVPRSPKPDGSRKSSLESNDSFEAHDSDAFRSKIDGEVSEDELWLPESANEEAERIAIVSPMVGVFYRSSGPDVEPYVEVGERIEVGQIIGLIEAMKVFSEVPSEVAGTVIDFAGPNGQLVRTGDPLIFLSLD